MSGIRYPFNMPLNRGCLTGLGSSCLRVLNKCFVMRVLRRFPAPLTGSLCCRLVLLLGNDLNVRLAFEHC